METDKDRRRNMVIGTSPIGDDELDTLRQIVDAKNKSEKRAGLVRTTDEGNLDEIEFIIPTETIHHFDNLDECTCSCHPKKRDCMECYDHPIHLKVKEDIVEKTYVKPKKRWWNR